MLLSEYFILEFDIWTFSCDFSLAGPNLSKFSMNNELQNFVIVENFSRFIDIKESENLENMSRPPNKLSILKILHILEILFLFFLTAFSSDNSETKFEVCFYLFLPT